MNELALFAGAGGGILGGKLLGWKTVCGVEWEPYPTSVLIARQNEGVLAPFPIWDDVRTFDGRPWRGRVDVVSGGFPCQDISCAGKGAGIDGERSGMWHHMARIVCDIRPLHVFVENSPLLTKRGLHRVLGDLAAMGYDARWGVLGAADAITYHGPACADHLRNRIWIVGTLADAKKLLGNGGKHYAGIGVERVTVSESGNDSGAQTLADAHEVGLQRQWPDDAKERREDAGGPTGLCNRTHANRRSNWWSSEPDVGRVAHGVAGRVDRLKAIGNGQVPAVAALAWKTLSRNL